MQAYYTKHRLANGIAQAMHQLLKPQGAPCTRLPLASALDLCAGAGNLIHAMHEHFLVRHTTLVDIDADALEKAERGLGGAKLQSYAMSAEEWALTYAQADQYELVVCNPPFGQRLGRSELGEQLQDLHLSELECFESYFLTVAASVCCGTMAFIIPDNYWKKPEARRTLQQLAALGFVPLMVRSMPLDGYENALVSTCLWVFQRAPADQEIGDWSADALRMGATAPALIHEPTLISRDDAYGRPLMGWGLNELSSVAPMNVYPIDASRLTMVALWPSATTPLWQPSPKAQGARWERLGVMYEFDEQEGWQMAQGEDYVDGKPIDDELQLALKAFEYVRAGALRCASSLLEGVDLDGLRARYGHLPGASCLALLPKHNKRAAQALTDDVRQLGMMTLHEEGDLELLGGGAAAPSIIMQGPWLIDPQSVRPDQLARLELEGDVLPDVLCARLDAAMRAQIIPDSQLKLRAGWLSKELVARYFGLKLDEDGYFWPDYSDKLNPPRNGGGWLSAWLNFGKGPKRIRNSDEEHYLDACDEFARAVHDWDDDKHLEPELRREVHLRWLVHQSGQRRFMANLTKLTPARPLRWWQHEDLSFAISGEAILSWDVGLGKTAGAIAAGMAHPGQVIVSVPKSVLSKWEREIQSFFPGARCGVLGFKHNKRGQWTTCYDELADQARALFYSAPVKFVLTTHEVLARLQIDEQVKQRFDEQDALSQTKGTNQRAKLKRERQIKRAAQRDFILGGELTFTDLPLAQCLLVVDEAHAFKSLHAMPTGGWGNQLLQTGHCGESKRARDMRIKCALLRSAGGKTLALTATPVTNSVVEVFNMLAIFAPSVLERRGINSPQSFIDTYCVREAITTVSVKGEVLNGQTISGFENLDDLQAMFSECMITRTAQSVGLELPDAPEHVIHIEPTPALSRFIRELQEQLDEQLEREVSLEDDVHIFTIISQIDAAAAHPPLVGISDEHPKADALLERVMPLYESTDGGQIIFCDRTQAHQGLVERLVAAGVARKHIACINGECTPQASARLKVQDDFNSGKLRIVIGGKMASEGIDLQHNCRSIHFMNIAWEDQTMHQRKGRGVRQGNEAESVQIYYYLLKGSTDIYRFATCQNKSHWWCSMREAQTDFIKATVFQDPMDEALVASLSAKPAEVLDRLKKAKLEGNAERELGTMRRLAKQLLRCLITPNDPKSIRLAVRMERALRALDVVDDALCVELLEAVQLIAGHKRRQGISPRVSDSELQVIKPISMQYGVDKLWQMLELKKRDDVEGASGFGLRYPAKTILKPLAGFAPLASLEGLLEALPKVERAPVRLTATGIRIELVGEDAGAPQAQDDMERDEQPEAAAQGSVGLDARDEAQLQDEEDVEDDVEQELALAPVVALKPGRKLEREVVVQLSLFG